MLRRKPSMAFAPGAYVFPGGSVDQRDVDEEVAWAGPGVDHWGQVFDAPPHLARALVCAAVRETFEESGVLLAGPSAGSVVADTTGEDWEADRQALLDRSLSLAEMLARRELILRADLLRPWSRWITPAVEPRRFDARFFAAALPEGQRTRDVGGEAAAVQWITPADALEAGRAGQIQLWLPTAMTLAELAEHADVGAVLAAQREVRPLLPEVVVTEGATCAEGARRPGIPAVTGAGEIDGSGTDRARCVLAPNPGLMTLDGTNTWLVAEPGSATTVVVDPGPDDGAHLRRVVSVAEQAGQRIAAIVLTHGHADHSGGARALAGTDRRWRAGRRPGAPARRRGPAAGRGRRGQRLRDRGRRDARAHGGLGLPVPARRRRGAHR